MSVFLVNKEVEFELSMESVVHATDATPYQDRECVMVAKNITRKGKPLDCDPIKIEIPFYSILHATYSSCNLSEDNSNTCKYCKAKMDIVGTELKVDSDSGQYSVILYLCGNFPNRNSTTITYAPSAKASRRLMTHLWEYYSGDFKVEKIIKNMLDGNE